VNEHPVQQVKVIPRPKSIPRANRPWTRAEWSAVVVAEAPKHLLAPIRPCGVLGWREGEVINRPRDRPLRHPRAVPGQLSPLPRRREAPYCDNSRQLASDALRFTPPLSAPTFTARTAQRELRGQVDAALAAHRDDSAGCREEPLCIG
jgi:hypothetical protein